MDIVAELEASQPGTERNRAAAAIEGRYLFSMARSVPWVAGETGRSG